MRSLVLIIAIFASLNSFAKVQGMSGSTEEDFIQNPENVGTETGLEVNEQCFNAITAIENHNLQVDFKKLEELNCKLEIHEND